MSNSNDHSPTPADKDLRIGKAKTMAGGIPTLLSSLKQVEKNLGRIEGAKLLLKANQKEGFDCPGCAWPDPKHRSTFEFCENGVKAIVDEATLMRATPAFFKKHSISKLINKSDRWLNNAGRISAPMILRDGKQHYEEISWEEAFQIIAQKLNGLDSPNEAIFYTSGRTSNEAAFLYQLLVRRLGTNNLPDCSNLCHESSGVGLSETIGIGKGSVLLDDFEVADCIFVVGQNPGTNHPRMMSALQSAARKGAKIISVNPLAEASLSAFAHPQELSGLLHLSTPISTQHLAVKINGDVALFKGICKVVLERKAEAKAFIKEKTLGYEAFVEDLKNTTWSDICRSSGLQRSEIEKAAEIYCGAERTIICWAMGITQHVNGVANVQSLVNLLLLKGNIGRPGAGVCPVRGHSNVQGDRTMGIVERPGKSFLKKLGDRFTFTPPQDHGTDAVNAIEAMYNKKAKIFFGMGGNFFSASPDTDYVAQGLRNCELTVHVSTKLNRSHLVHGKRAIILPCLGRTERDTQESGPQFVSVENSMGIVHRSKGTRVPASEQLLSEVAIVCRLALALGFDDIDWAKKMNNYDEIRTDIAHVIPGFEKYNERVRNENGFELPNGPRKGEFTTVSGKAHFTTHPIPHHILKKDEFLLSTVRSHDQYNTTIYSDDDRYRGIKKGRRIAMMNPKDMEELDLGAGDLVDIISDYDDVIRCAPNFSVVPYRVPRRSIFSYFPEANVLIPIALHAEKSRTPASKSVRVKIKKLQ